MRGDCTWRKLTPEHERDDEKGMGGGECRGGVR